MRDVKNLIISAILAALITSVGWGYGIGINVAINKTEITNLKEQYKTINTKLDALLIANGVQVRTSNE